MKKRLVSKGDHSVGCVRLQIQKQRGLWPALSPLKLYHTFRRPDGAKVWYKYHSMSLRCPREHFLIY